MILDSSKTCRVCHETKSSESFHKLNRSKDGRDNKCIDCKHVEYKLKHPQPEYPEGCKPCTKCGEVKPATLEFFHKRGEYGDGLMYHCKICRNKAKSIYVT